MDFTQLFIQAHSEGNKRLPAARIQLVQHYMGNHQLDNISLFDSSSIAWFNVSWLS